MKGVDRENIYKLVERIKMREKHTYMHHRYEIINDNITRDNILRDDNIKWDMSKYGVCGVLQKDQVKKRKKMKNEKQWVPQNVSWICDEYQ